MSDQKQYGKKDNGIISYNIDLYIEAMNKLYYYFLKEDGVIK